MTHERNRMLTVAGLARVEGEGSLRVRVRDGEVADVKLDIFEPPRFFEAFLRGRSYREPPDITARICGICPVAYQTSACQAIEAACGVQVNGQLADLRRLLYCGEWISSHALHIYFLHAPDFLGYPGAIELARDQREVVERGLALRRAGNAIMETVGGRAVHPVNVQIGGFYRAPARSELAALTGQLEAALEVAVQTVAWVAGFDFPDFSFDHELLALSQPGSYPIERGTLISSAGRSFAAAEFDQHVVEEQVPHSTALHARLTALAGDEPPGPYLTGPLARYALNAQWLTPAAAQAAAAAGLDGTCRNPFRSIIVRAVEVVYAVEEALRLIAGYQEPALSWVEVPARAGVGYGVSEAPRGVLYHRYEITGDGLISAAKIVPPTSQNQAAIEDDLGRYVQSRLDLDDTTLTRQCEQAVRNYDPCISCAAHFLTVVLDRA